MSNEEQMRTDFERALGPLNFVLDRDSFGDYRLGGTQDAWTAWQAATASKQREIDALNQRVRELSAQVAVMLEALETVADSGICNGAYTLHEECHKAVYGVLITPPSAALEAHDNEVAAKALEHAADHEDLYDKRDVLRRMAAERRSEK